MPSTAPATLSAGKCTLATVLLTAIRQASRNSWSVAVTGAPDVRNPVSSMATGSEGWAGQAMMGCIRSVNWVRRGQARASLTRITS